MQNDIILGWAALTPVSKREVYKGVAEDSVYVDEKYRGQGIGKALLERLIDLSEEKGFWTLQTRIFPENIVSVKLHKRCGFRIVGTHKRIGKMRGEWRDVTIMERRSTDVGV